MRSLHCRLHSAKHNTFSRGAALSHQACCRTGHLSQIAKLNRNSRHRRQPALCCSRVGRGHNTASQSQPCIDQGGGSGEGGGNNRLVDPGDEDRELPGSHWGLLGIALTFVSSSYLTVSKLKIRHCHKISSTCGLSLACRHAPTLLEVTMMGGSLQQVGRLQMMQQMCPTAAVQMKGCCLSHHCMMPASWRMYLLHISSSLCATHLLDVLYC